MSLMLPRCKKSSKKETEQLCNGSIRYKKFNIKRTDGANFPIVFLNRFSRKASFFVDIWKRRR